LPDIPGDAVQLSQVLANLLRNALEALADQPRKQITIATRRLAKAVELCVSDNGPGLPAEVQSHLFEPFFTTKPEGLGLGLAISRSLVEAHGGQLLAENAPEGTCFRVRLPVPTSQAPGA
jgi:signal transduction histidine kinase